MQMTFPRFTGSALVNFARQIGDILDLKSITIEDTTDGKAGFGAGNIAQPKFTFEAQDGATASISPEPGPESALNALLSSRWVLAELDRRRKTVEVERPPEPATRPFRRDEALRIIDRIRNEVGGIKARFADDFIPMEDTSVRGEILFNDNSTITIDFVNVGPMTPDVLDNLIVTAKLAKRNNLKAAGDGGDSRIGPSDAPADAQPEQKG